MIRAYCPVCHQHHATRLVGEARSLHSIAMFNAPLSQARAWLQARDEAEVKARRNNQPKRTEP